ncbi:MAG: RNA polymerase sigma factor [Ferruginibacter sp.]
MSADNFTISEKELINGCLSDNRKMQELLYNRYSAKMYAVCLRYSNNAEDARDLLQEGFVKVYRNIEKYRGEGSFEGWIRRIFVNTSIEHFRKKMRIAVHSDTEELQIEDSGFSAVDALAEKDVIAMIQQLSPGYRQIFNMYIIEGFTHKEIGEILGISEGTSKSQLARAKGILKKMIEQKLYLN